MIRKSDVRCIGHYTEYPGSCSWPEYEYRCPECDKWTPKIHGNISTVHDDGTESYLCFDCGTQAEAEFVTLPSHLSKEFS